MITIQEKKQLKQVLGNNYTSRVIKILEDRGIKNTRGLSFSTNSIRQVFNGNISNLEIEIAIYDLRDEIVAKQKQLKEKKNHYKSQHI